MKVRAATAADADGIAHVHLSSWKTTYAGIVHQSYLDDLKIESRIANAQRKLANEALTCFVLENESGIIGFADLGPNREKNVDSDGELFAIYLLEEFQGRGGGRLLFDECVRAARKRAFKTLLISVLKQNIGSREFYERQGAVLIGEDHVDIEEHRYPTSTYLFSIPRL